MTFTPTTNTPIKLPNNPKTGESVTINLAPEDLTLRFTWLGTDDNSDTDFWRVMGDFSWGNQYDDLYVSKTGDKMSGFLINLNKILGEYDPNGDNELIPLGTHPNYVSLVAKFEQSGLTLYGSYGIEDNKELPLVSSPLKIINDAIISGSVSVGREVKVLRHPFLDGGEVGETVSYTYKWQRCNDRRYGGVDPRNRDVDQVTKAEIYSQGDETHNLGDFNTTTTSDTTGSSGCVITIEELNEDGQVVSFSIKSGGSGYRPAEILDVDGTDIQIIVTDTVQLNKNEEQPPSGDVCWEVNEDIDPNHLDYYILTEEDINSYVRCVVSCTVGSETVHSKSNPIGIIY